MTQGVRILGGRAWWFAAGAPLVLVMAGSLLYFFLPANLQPYVLGGVVAAGVATAISLAGAALLARRYGPLLDELRESESHHRSLIQTLDGSVVVIDERGTIRSVNPATERLFGYDRADLLGRNVRLLMPESFAHEHDAYIRRYLDTGEKRIIGIGREVTGLRRDGSELPLQLYVSEMRRNGDRLFTGVMNDISVRKRAEREAAEARVLAEQAAAAQARFLANMSHEIRTPMNGVLGMLDLMSKGRLPPEEQGYLEVAQQSAEALLAIINDVLDLSKIRAGRFELDRGVFDLHRALEDVTSIAASLAVDKALQVNCLISETVPRHVSADRARLRQVLLNLLGNAVKFTERGTVDLMAEVVRRTEQATEISFAVRDTGIGIEPDRLESLFDPFMQADATVTRRYGGTGLGLAISRQLAELMGGTIDAESEPGRGSTFRFTAPFEVAAADREPAQAHHPVTGPDDPPSGEQGGSPATILLAEDRSINRQVCLEMLRRLGCAVIVAEDGREAVRQAQQRRFDLIFMDNQMPVMDGLTATREIRRWELEQGAGRTPIVALTAQAMRGDREKCLDAGMDDYVSKPFRMADLERVLEEWLPVRPQAPGRD